MTTRFLNVFMVTMVIIGALTFVGGAKAQDSASQPVWLAEVETVSFGGEANVRVDASRQTMNLGVIPEGAVAERLAEWTNGTETRSLVRASQGQNYWFGWVNNADARFTPTTELVSYPECALIETGRQLPVLVRFGNLYAIDQKISGCALIVEGRQNNSPVHHIWVLRGENANEVLEEMDLSETNGVLTVMQASAWAYTETWNAQDFANEQEVALAKMLAVEKRANQLDEGYDWDIVVHMTNKNTVTFKAGSEMPVVEVWHGETEPVLLQVAGTFDDDGAFTSDASVGSTGRTTVAQIDDNLYFWVGAEDNLSFSYILAYLMPAGWTEAQIATWAAETFPDMVLETLPESMANPTSAE